METNPFLPFGKNGSLTRNFERNIFTIGVNLYAGLEIEVQPHEPLSAPCCPHLKKGIGFKI
jgi:hypothetical protein